MNFRTDLALERREMLGVSLSGVEVEEKTNDECKITIIDVKNQRAAEKIGKGIGRYITIETSSFSDSAELSSVRLKTVIDCIKTLLPKQEGTIVVSGVGNLQMTSDALGPETALKILATRHINDELREKTGIKHRLRPVVAFSTGVLGQTGIESGEYIKSICDVVKPCCVITIDALASGSITRLGKTIQMSNTGIAPGSGIGNSRVRIDEALLGVPVIAIGVPTVVDALCLTGEICNVDVTLLSKEQITKGKELIVAPKDVDLLIKNASTLLGLAINCALQPEFTTQEMYSLM